MKKLIFLLGFIPLIALAQTPIGSAPASSQYLSIVLQYEGRMHFYHITEGPEQVRSVAVLSEAVAHRKERFEREGYEVRILPRLIRYDNRVLFQLIEEYEAQGWKIHSQSLSLSRSESEITTNSERVQYFLFTKEKSSTQMVEFP
ncbi:MAG: hypothetical protein AAF927_10145 [Bacteroidota bacterium]